VILGQRIINAILRPLVALLLPHDVQGQENLPAEGPVIVMLNHVNFLDVIMPAMFLPRDVVMVAKTEIYRAPGFGLLVRAYGAVPLRRGEADLQAMRLSLEALRKGQVLGIAPEGTRSGHGRLQQGHDGLAFVAVQAGVPVVPFAIYGHNRFWEDLKRLRRTRLHIRVGEPFRFVARKRPQRDGLRAMTDEAMYRLAALLPPEFRGVYGDPSRATRCYTEPHTPPMASCR
jgi:1-acyl-sn-glycerol-3-phosphate acyltransferase